MCREIRKRFPWILGTGFRAAATAAGWHWANGHERGATGTASVASVLPFRVVVGRSRNATSKTCGALARLRLDLSIEEVCHLGGVATEALAEPVAHPDSATRPTDAPAYGVTYDADGNVTETTSAEDGTATGSPATAIYGYNNVNELESASYSGWNTAAETAPSAFGCTYDADGNRVTTGANTDSTGNDNELKYDGTYNYIYDADGNCLAKFICSAGSGFTGDSIASIPNDATQVTIYTWDNRNRLTEADYYESYTGPGCTATWTATYVYDYLNRLVDETIQTTGVGTQQTGFAYDGAQAVLDFQNANTGPLRPGNLTDRYLWNPQAVDQLFADEEVHGLSGGGAGTLWRSPTTKTRSPTWPRSTRASPRWSTTGSTTVRQPGLADPGRGGRLPLRLHWRNARPGHAPAGQPQPLVRSVNGAVDEQGSAGDPGRYEPLPLLRQQPGQRGRSLRPFGPRKGVGSLYLEGGKWPRKGVGSLYLEGGKADTTDFGESPGERCQEPFSPKLPDWKRFLTPFRHPPAE